MSTLIKGILNNRKLARWNSTPKDLVILHCFGRDKTLPSASPFVMKIHTYLRMTGVPYKIDSKDPFGPKGKAPWISLNGEHVADSEHIVAFLNKKLGKDLNAGHSPQNLALATAVRVMLEEQITWGIALERFVFDPAQFRKVSLGKSPISDFVIQTMGGRIAKKRADAHGIGLHSKAEIEEFVGKSLRALSVLLGSNTYMLGNNPCQGYQLSVSKDDDCAIFGQLAQAVWGVPDSYYEKLVHDELTNLRDYCFRMKEKYYPDWDQLTSRVKKPLPSKL